MHSWKDALYDNLPQSTPDDLFPNMKGDKAFEKSMNSLFERGWRIVPAESMETQIPMMNLQVSYLKLLSPDSKYIPLRLEAGISYMPIQSPSEQLISMTYERSKQISMESMKYDVEKGIYTVNYEESVEKIEEFEDVRILRAFTEMTNPEIWKEINGVQIKEPGLSCVFKYRDRAVIMVWAMIERFAHEIIKVLSETAD